MRSPLCFVRGRSLGWFTRRCPLSEAKLCKSFHLYSIFCVWSILFFVHIFFEKPCQNCSETFFIKNAKWCIRKLFLRGKGCNHGASRRVAWFTWSWKHKKNRWVFFFPMAQLYATSTSWKEDSATLCQTKIVESVARRSKEEHGINNVANYTGLGLGLGLGRKKEQERGLRALAEEMSNVWEVVGMAGDSNPTNGFVPPTANTTKKKRHTTTLS